MNMEYWIIGPQLIGLIFLLVSLIQTCYPPKNINPLYGYRTSTSMQNQQTWDEANCYSARYMRKAGAITIFAGLLFTYLLTRIVMDLDLRMGILAVTLVVVAITIPVLLMRATEQHLAKFFQDNN